MRKVYLCLFVTVLFFYHRLPAQSVAINTDGSTAHASAMLEVKASNKGVLIPRVALTGMADISSISSPATSLLVYNSATAGSGNTAVSPGFYYWGGTGWIRMAGNTDLSTLYSSVWGLSGNAGTTADNFIGTTDDQPLLFRVSNDNAGKLTTSSLGNTALGHLSLNSMTGGAYNTAFGNRALYSNIAGHFNVSIGSNSLSKSLSSGNTAVGNDAMTNNTSGSRNSAVGYTSLENNTEGNFNTAMGTRALGSNTSGSYNSALGYEANVGSGTVSNSTAIGAMALVESNNAIVLGSIKGINNATSDVNVGIGTTSPTALLHVETGSNYTYGFLVKGSLNYDRSSVPDLGLGVRMMFYPGKAAFRAGYVTGTQWNNANVAPYSMAMGYNTTASGNVSTAMGTGTTASAHYSTAMGNSTIASALYSTAMGNSSAASGESSTAMGGYTSASGVGSTAMGTATAASGDHSTAMGNNTTAKAYAGTSIGAYNDNADQPSATTPVASDRIFQVGNGNYSSRSNALTILRSGNIGVGTTSPSATALLDLSSSNKGLLVPRMTEAQRSGIVTPATGLLVYQTDGSIGFYFYNGGWTRLAASTDLASSVWSLSGNAGTTSATFIGTTDDQPLIFKVNNTIAGRLSTGYNNNTIWGYNALANNTGTENTANGYEALHRNGSGNGNTAMGYHVLSENFNGTNNSAVGINALSWNMSGDRNTVMGEHAMYLNREGDANTAVGASALMYNISGEHNTATGASSLYYNTTGYHNTAVGVGALMYNETGNNNTAIGAYSQVGGDNLFNGTAIGANAIVNASNKVRIGDASVTVIEGQVGFTTPSDGRYKYNIKEDVHGLDFILKLRPITYQFDVKRMEEQMSGKAINASYVLQASYKEAAAMRRTGFIAQEVEKAANAVGYNFSGLNKPKSEKDYYGLSYESFVVPLVKAVQQQQAIINNQADELKALKQQLEQLTKVVEALSNHPQNK